jgi:hypothetical protein
MPISDRDYIRGQHPPTCTCAECVARRLNKVKKQNIPEDKQTDRITVKWPSKLTRKTIFKPWHWIPPSIIKLLLCLLIITGLADIIHRGYRLFTHHTDPIINTVIFLVEIGIWFWVITVLRSRRYKYRKPKFKLILTVVIVITIVCAFAGIEPLSSYKDNVFSLVNNYLEEQKLSREDVKISEEEAIVDEDNTVTSKWIPEGVTNISVSNYEEIFNQYRQSQGYEPLIFSDDLNHIATFRLAEIKLDYSHYSKGGYNKHLAENINRISFGSLSNYEALNIWKASPLHNKNILDPNYIYTGYANGGGYAVQLFSSYETINGEPQLPPGLYWDD